MRSIPEKAMQVLLHPVRFLSKNTDGYQEIFKYLLLLTLVPAGIGASLYAIYPDEGIAADYREIGIEITPLLLFFFAYLDSISVFLLASAAVHAFAYVWGARYGFRSTARAVAFSYTPVLLFGWLPWINYLALAWMLALLVLGLKEQHKIPATHAIGALITPVVSLILLSAISALIG